MTYRRLQQFPDPALSVPPASPALALLALTLGCVLIAVTIWSGSLVRPLLVSSLMSAQTSTQLGALKNAAPVAALHIVDSQRALIFDADPGTGDVRVLNVRSGITEIARLHEQHRQNVSAISLDTRRQVLTVESDSARYEYDTRTFRLLQHKPILARAPNT